MDLTSEQKFQAIKERYVDHVELLRFMTKLDLQLFVSYIGFQLALGGWISQHPGMYFWGRAGLLMIDAAFALIAGILLYYNFRRRQEVSGTLKNINIALKFNEPGAYLPDVALNAPTTFRPWGKWYIIGVVTAFVGMAMILIVGV